MTLRRSNRATRIDYAALNESHIIHERNVHPHIPEFQKFARSQISNSNNNDIILIDENYNTKFTDDNLAKIIETTKLSKPILIRGANPQVPETYNENIKLNFNIPNYNIEKYTQLIGSNVKVPVMDTMTQNNSRNWDMLKWCNYFSSETHDKIRNVISLEISQTKLGSQINVPRVVENIDIIRELYNDPKFAKLLLENEIDPPKVQKYILMSVRNCFTDFHIDFAGTSVYYSLVKGHKQFILLPPTNDNLRAYKSWCLSDIQQHLWFPSTVKNNGILIDVKPGDLLLLPSLWIHAVHTLDDSIIIGGNFLNAHSLDNHIRAHKLETETCVPDQFRFPNLLRFMWLIAYYYYLKKPTNELELNAYKSVVNFLNDEWLFVKNSNLKRGAVAKLKAAVPRNIIGDPQEFLNLANASIDDEAEPIRKKIRKN